MLQALSLYSRLRPFTSNARSLQTLLTKDATGTRYRPCAQRVRELSKTRAAAEGAVTTTPDQSGAKVKGGNGDVSGPMLSPSPANKPWVRAAAVTAAVAAATGGTTLLPATGAAFVHLTTYAIFLGTNVWNSFFVGITMFKNMPRQMFGRVQSKLFPLYFGLTTSCNALLLGSLMLVPSSLSTTSVLATLGASLGASLLNWLVLEPKCTSLMFERYDLENKEGKTESDLNRIKELYKEFGKYHGLSSVVNLVVLCCASSHGWSLAATMTL